MYDLAFQMRITGGGGGDWLVDTSSADPKVTSGVGEGAAVTLTLTSEDFQVFYEGGATQALFMKGRLKITGTLSMASRAQDVLRLSGLR